MHDTFWEQRPEHMPLGKLVRCAASLINRHFQQVCAEHGLTPTTMGVLGSLAHTDGLSHRQLADRMMLSPATLTPVLDALEEAGEVRRDRDPQDRRVVRLHLTVLGELRLGAAAGVVVAAFRGRMPCPSPEDEQIIRGYLLAVMAALNDDAPLADEIEESA
ncbi:MAG: MarR family transcriptional regulator [Pseudonocardiales bacterium]|nr:MarR family transcriptional regulator [Pseudonocardiales bacterium]